MSNDNHEQEQEQEHVPQPVSDEHEGEKFMWCEIRPSDLMRMMELATSNGYMVTVQKVGYEIAVEQEDGWVKTKLENERLILELEPKNYTPEVVEVKNDGEDSSA